MIHPEITNDPKLTYTATGKVSVSTEAWEIDAYDDDGIFLESYRYDNNEDYQADCVALIKNKMTNK